MKKSKSIKLVVLGVAFLVTRPFGYSQNASPNATTASDSAQTTEQNKETGNAGLILGIAVVTAIGLGVAIIRGGFGRSISFGTGS